MNTLFTSRLNGIFILNTLLELHKPVTVSELAGIINHRYDHVTAPQTMTTWWELHIQIRCKIH